MIPMSKFLNKSKPKKKFAIFLTALTLLLSFRVNLFIALDVMTTLLLTHNDLYLGTTLFHWDKWAHLKGTSTTSVAQQHSVTFSLPFLYGMAGAAPSVKVWGLFCKLENSYVKWLLFSWSILSWCLQNVIRAFYNWSDITLKSSWSLTLAKYVT